MLLNFYLLFVLEKEIRQLRMENKLFKQEMEENVLKMFDLYTLTLLEELKKVLPSSMFGF